MLGLQETRSPGTPTTKTYSCVACSATFQSLASLLVHQASHANEISCQPESTLPSCITCGSSFASADLLEKHHCVVLPASTAPEMNICDCGEEFNALSALEEHKKLHKLDTKISLEMEQNNKTNSSHPITDQTSPSQCLSKEEFPFFKSSSTSESNKEMASSKDTSILMKDNIKNISSDSVPDIKEMASTADSLIQMKEHVKITSSDLEANFKERDSTTDASIKIKQNVQSVSSNLEGNIKEMASTTDTSIHMEEVLQSLIDMASTTEVSVPVEENIVNEQDENILKRKESLVSHPVGEEQDPVLEKNSDTSEPSSTSNHPEHASEESANSHKESAVCNKQSILRILASAYMSHRKPGHIEPIPTRRNLPPRKVAPRAPMQASTVMTVSSGSKSESLEDQSNTKCPENVLSLPSTTVNMKTGKKKKKKKIKLVTQTFYPVVMLETRQKLIGKDLIEGRHKCGICRRVFQDGDSLIMHHVQHKKEKVKFCFRCQQFVFCPAENHKCSGIFAANNQRIPIVENKFQTLSSPSPTTAQKKRKFQCSLCKRSYIWKRNLKRHHLKGNCTPIVDSSANQSDGKHLPNSSNSQQITSLSKLQPSPLKNDCKRPLQDSKINDISKQHINVGVGTERIKTEEQNTEIPIEGTNPTLLKMPSPSLKPVNLLPSPSFLSNSRSTESSKMEQNVNMQANVVENNAGNKDEFEEKQWTMPLDDAEIDVLIDAEQEDLDNEDSLADVSKKLQNDDEDVVIVESPEDIEMESLLPSSGFNVHVSDEGIKRYVCAGCQRSYSRRFTLMQHLSICGARKLKQQKKTISSHPEPIKKFPCPQCGKFFSRKDNMNMHRKRCQGTITNPPIGLRNVEHKSPSQENLFVLSPSTDTPSVRPESSRSSGSNWGIMSLPPVLPRRVTCECGSSFTCPRLLFEHLQLHAQESYICPHCGENLQSWMDFEAHQQTHRQSQSQAVEQRGPQLHNRSFPQVADLHIPTPQQPRSFSQVLQSHIPSVSQQSQGFQIPELNLKAQPSTLMPPQKINHSPCPEPVTCHRCKKTFAGRRSLLRHLRLSCRGDAPGPKKHSVQIQTNASRPAIKPLRCPVCVRWFSCLDGLKRHLVSHSRQPILSCQQCGKNYPSYEALEEHKRNDHKVNSGIVVPDVKQENVCKEVAKFTPPTDFQCHICLRYYPKLQSLKDHVRKVHRPKQAKPINLSVVVDPFRSGQFQCQICMRAYPDIKSLKNHRRRVHRILGGVFQLARGPEQNRTPDHFQCQICGSAFSDMSSLQNHKRTVHRILSLEFGNNSAKAVQSAQVSNLSTQLS